MPNRDQEPKAQSNSPTRELNYSKKYAKKSISIGLVGLQSAGKTTYLAMLYELLQNQENLFGKGCVPDPNSQDYLDDKRNSIKSGERVPATDPMMPFEDIYLEVLQGDRTIRVNLFDYAGEKTKPREQEDLRQRLRYVNGVLIFLPPEALENEEQDDLTVNAVQKLFADLAEVRKTKNAVEAIAIVASKADELKKRTNNDEENILPYVEEKFSRIMGQIRNRSRHNKTFIVSSLGDLYTFTTPSTPQTPKPYGVIESFIWLIQTIKKTRFRHRLRYLLLGCLIFLMLAIAAWHGLSNLNSNMQNDVKMLQSQCQEIAENNFVERLRCLRKWHTALLEYSSWKNILKDRRFLSAGHKVLQQNIESTAPLLLNALNQENDVNKAYDFCRQVIAEASFSAKLRKDLDTWLTHAKTKQLLAQTLKGLSVMSEDSISNIQEKLDIINTFIKTYPTINRHLRDEKTRLITLQRIFKDATYFNSIKLELERQPDPWRRYQSITRIIKDPKWTQKQREWLDRQQKVYRLQAVAAEWGGILVFDSQNATKWQDRIKKRIAFRNRYPEEAKRHQIETQIHKIYLTWDVSEYNKIRNAFESDPINGIDSVAGTCQMYLDDGRPFKNFEAPVKDFIDWYQKLKEESKYDFKFKQVVGEDSELFDGKPGGEKVQVTLRVNNNNTESIVKKTGDDGVATDLGNGKIGWKLGDSLVLKLECFAYGNESTNIVLKGRATLAYLAGERWMVFDNDKAKGSRVLFKLINDDDWYKFPPSTDDLDRSDHEN